MQYNIKNIIGASALFATAVHGHISMSSPTPYGKPDTSPLSPSGSDYPCKTGNGFTINSVTNMKVGESQKLAFSGTAVHGGGSCQLSLAKGYKPDANTQFKTILSIEGGCPGVDGGTTSYDFKIPSEVGDGEYTLAWTWFNKIGNREMYMNCAPIKVSGGSGDQLSSLPDMAIFNVASKNQCKTSEGGDVAFPNPGKYVQKGSGYKALPPLGSGCGSSSGGSADAAPATAAPAADSGASTGSSGASTSSGSSGSFDDGQYHPDKGSSSASTGSTGSSGSASSGTFAEGASSASTTATPPAPVAAAPAAPNPPAVAAAPASNSSSSTSGSSTSSSASAPASGDGKTCTSDGAVVCSADGSQFGLCNFGSAVMLPVAAGTKCQGGKIMKRYVFRG